MDLIFGLGTYFGKVLIHHKIYHYLYFQQLMYDHYPHQRKLNHHHVDYFRGINHVDKIQAVCDWECARKTKPDKPLNAAETLKNIYPQYTQDFINVFVNLGLGKQLVETFGK